MTTKKSKSMKYLENITGAPLSLSELLYAIRLGEEMSQVEFAKNLKISRSHLCDIEKGRKNISVERAVLFAKILKYSEDQFVRLALQDLVNNAGLDYKVDVDAA